MAVITTGLGYEESFVQADISTYLKSRSNVETLDFHKVYRHVLQKLGKGGVIGITTFHDLRYERALEKTVQQGIPIRSLEIAYHVIPYDLLVIKCQRIMTQQGDIDAVGVRRGCAFPEHRSLEETLKMLDQEHVFINVPNPFHGRGLGPYLKEHPDNLEFISALTVYSGEGALWVPGIIPKGSTKSPNQQALDFYHEIKKDFPHVGCIAASNSSNVRDIGTSQTRLIQDEPYEAFKMPDDVLNMFSLISIVRPESDLHIKPLRLSALRHQAYVMLDNNIPFVSPFIQKHSHLQQAHQEFEKVLKK